MNKKIWIGLLTTTLWMAQRGLPAAVPYDPLPTAPRPAYDGDQKDEALDTHELTDLEFENVTPYDPQKEMEKRKAILTQKELMYRESNFRYGPNDEGTQRQKEVYETARDDYRRSVRAYRQSLQEQRAEAHAIKKAQKDLAKSPALTLGPIPQNVQ